MSSYAVDRQKWSEMSIFEQMGNIYSEVGRAFKAKEKGDSEGIDQAVTRALDLFDATVESLRRKNPARLKEVLRAKDQFLQFVYKENPGKENLDSLDRYFRDYAIAARR